jgi:hypothetical protein
MFLYSHEMLAFFKNFTSRIFVISLPYSHQHYEKDIFWSLFNNRSKKSCSPRAHNAIKIFILHDVD